jgi:exosortase A
MHGGLTLQPPLSLSVVDTPLKTIWRQRSITLGLCVVALVVIYWNTAVAIISMWSTDPLAHGYLVVPAAIYLAWVRRDRLLRTLPTPAYWLLPLLGVVAFVWLLGNISGTTVVQQACLVAMVIGLACGVLGLEAGRVLLLPFAFLLFALPIASRLIPPLQILTARFAVKMLALSHVPVLLQGHVISIPGGAWNVAEACSGINYLTASLAIGCLYAGISYRTWRNRLGFLVASALVPLIANGLRVYGTILVTHLGGTQIAAGTRHYVFGWVVFAAMMAVLFITCGHWHEDPVGPAETLNPHAESTSVGIKSPLIFIAAAFVLLAWAPISAAMFERSWRSTPSSQHARVVPAFVSSPWLMIEGVPFRWNPKFFRTAADGIAAYRRDRKVAAIYVATYGAYQPDAKLVGNADVLFDDQWILADVRKREIALDGQSINARETRLEDGSSTLVIWTWYWVDGKFTGSDYIAKAYFAKARLFHSSAGSAAIAVAARSSDPVEATNSLADFISHVSLSPTLRALRSREEH